MNRYLNKTLLVTSFLILSINVSSQLDSVMDENKGRTQAAAVSQAKIDSTQIKTDKASTEYKSVSKQIEGLKVYNAQKRKQIKRQVERMKEIEKTMKYASVLQRQIPPLARRMHAGLEQFVALDLPFSSGERTERLKFIQDALDNPTVSPAEKLRQVLEGFDIEAEYGAKNPTIPSKKYVPSGHCWVNLNNIEWSLKILVFPDVLINSNKKNGSEITLLNVNRVYWNAE